MSDDFEFMPHSDDPAAEFLARESEELGELSEELGISNPSTFEEPTPNQNGVNAGTPVFGMSRSPNLVSNPFMREEPESIQKWRLEHEERLRHRDEDEAKKKQELRDQAAKELQDWYSRYDDQLVKTKASNREKEKDFVAEVTDIEPGTEWARVSKLCNFNVNLKSSAGFKHVKDVSRLKSIVLQLKQQPIARHED